MRSVSLEPDGFHRAGQTQRLVELGGLGALLALLRYTPPAPGILNVSLKALHVVFARGDAFRDAQNSKAAAMLDTYFDAADEL